MWAMTANFNSSEVTIGPRGLEGILYLPREPIGLIIFAHGSGSSRFSPRNTFVAERLVDCGFAALLFDLLAVEEAEDRRNVFDISLLGARVREAIAWASRRSQICDLPIGLFGASTGAAAALVAAAYEPTRIAAIVSRGGRPDLAGEALAQVKAPTLLIVGGFDHDVLELNHHALRQLRCEARLDIVPGATHLFEEAGTLEKVVTHAVRWFLTHVPNSDEQGSSSRA
jgi:putative phosphoribosyl transferase